MWVAAHQVRQREYRVFELFFEVFHEMETGNLESAKQNTTEQNAGKQTVDSVTAPTPLYSSTSTHEFGDGPKYPAVAMTHYAAHQ